MKHWLTSTIAGVLFAGIGSVSSALTSYAPGDIIPLDVSKITQEAPGQIVNQCMFEQTLKSLLPKAWSALTSADTVVNVKGEAEAIEEYGSSAKIPMSLVLPNFESKTTYNEWTTPTTATKHFANFTFSATGYYEDDEVSLNVEIQTNAETRFDKITLLTNFGLPRLEIQKDSAETCTDNNWGRETCKATNTILSANLVIPKAFVPKFFWENYDSGHATKKEFDASEYADCLAFQWSNR